MTNEAILKEYKEDLEILKSYNLACRARRRYAHSEKERKYLKKEITESGEQILQFEEKIRRMEIV